MTKVSLSSTPAARRISQHLVVTVVLSGAAPAAITAHGQDSGSHIALAAGSVAIWLQDQDAVNTYTDAWLDGVAAETHRFLPPYRPTDAPVSADYFPGLAITARGSDYRHAIYDPRIQELSIRVGYVTWIIRDRAAYDALALAWGRVRLLSPLVFPDHC